MEKRLQELEERIEKTMMELRELARETKSIEYRLNDLGSDIDDMIEEWS